MGGEIITCAVLADRSGGLAALSSPLTGRSYPLRALWRLTLPTYIRVRNLPGLQGRSGSLRPGSTGAAGATA